MRTKEAEKDQMRLLRKMLSRPNYAILSLLTTRSPMALGEIYSILGESFTRKTLILALRELALNMNLIQPQHVRYGASYAMGYKISPEIADVVRRANKLEKEIEENAKERR